ncbi:unnamed protein product [Sphagnum tenellum]
MTKLTTFYRRFLQPLKCQSTGNNQIYVCLMTSLLHYLRSQGEPSSHQQKAQHLPVGPNTLLETELLKQNFY